MNIHYLKPGRWITSCERNIASVKKLEWDWQKVTCKACLLNRPKEVK